MLPARESDEVVREDVDGPGAPCAPVRSGLVFAEKAAFPLDQDLLFPGSDACRRIPGVRSR